MLGSQAPAPGTIATPSRTPRPGRPGLPAGGRGEGPAASRSAHSEGRPVPDRRRPSGGPALLPVGMMQQRCRRDGGRAEARHPPLPSAPGSSVSPHPTRGRRLPQLAPTVPRGPGLWALFPNPLVGIPGLWGSWRDFRADPEGGRGLSSRRTGKGSAHSWHVSPRALPLLLVVARNAPLAPGSCGLCSPPRAAGLFHGESLG